MYIYCIMACRTKSMNNLSGYHDYPTNIAINITSVLLLWQAGGRPPLRWNMLPVCHWSQRVTGSWPSGWLLSGLQRHASSKPTNAFFPLSFDPACKQFAGYSAGPPPAAHRLQTMSLSTTDCHHEQSSFSFLLPLEAHRRPTGGLPVA